MGRAASFLAESDNRLRQRVKAALTYPVVVAGIAVLLVVAMLVFVVPTFAAMFENLGGELPGPTQFLVSLSESASWLVPVSIVVVIAGVMGYRRGYAGSAGFRMVADRAKLKLPVFGNLVRKVALARFARTMALLLRAGVPILQALDIVADTTGNEVLSLVAQDVKESVRGGHPMASPMSQHAVIPSMVVQMVVIGEDTGSVDTMLDKVADFYDQEVESTTESLTSVIEPLMIAVLGAVVGSMIVALYLPMFQVYELVR